MAPSSPTHGRTDPRWIALVALFVLSLPLVTPRIYASDEIEYFAYLRSLWFDRDLSFDNEYRAFHDSGIRPPGFYETFIEPVTPTGVRRNFAPIGCALLWAPFYAIGHLAARSLNALGYAVAADGYSAPYIRAVTYGSAVYGFLSLQLALLSVGRVLGRRLVTSDYAAALAVWWGTPLLFYMYIAPPMSHATSAFAVAAFVWTWLRVRGRWTIGGFAALGALAALMAMVREQDIFFVAGPALDLAWTAMAPVKVAQGFSPALSPPRLDPRRVARGLAAGAACFALVYLPQALAYLTLNGRLGPSELVARKMTWYAPHALDVLASPEHGFLFWTPLGALAIAGLVWITRNTSHLVGACLLAMVAAQIYIAGSVESWTVAGAFGQRRFVGLTAILVLGLAALFDAATRPRRRTLVIGLAAIAAWWNIGLMVQFGSGLMDRQRLELGSITYNNFVTVPARLPQLAYRYMVARSSFYRSPGPGARSPRPEPRLADPGR